MLALVLLVLASTVSPLPMTLEPLGDADSGVITRLEFRFGARELAPGSRLVVQGSFLRDGRVLRNFRFEAEPGERSIARIETLPEGEIEVEARLLLDAEPVILAKSTQKFTLAKIGKPFVEGVVPRTAGAVRIASPRRDVAPNLFIIDVDVEAPVTRVEFSVDGKKILAQNKPPYRAELDLGKLPKRVEVRATGFDAKGRYVDADAFIVNERDTPLEITITRTNTPDGVSHVKLSAQTRNDVRSVTLFAGERKLHEFSQPPYALDIPSSQLASVDFLRAIAVDDRGNEASHVLSLNGQQPAHATRVDAVQLPVTLSDAAGLTRENFTVLENGKPQKITSFTVDAPLSVGMILDHTGSMEKRRKPARDAALAFFKNILEPGDAAFIGGFALDPATSAPFVASIGSLEAQADAIPGARRGSALYDAIITGLYRFRSVQGRKALVIVTDDPDSTSRLTYDDMLTYARASRVPLYFIGIGMGIMERAGTSKMKLLAAESGGVAYFVRDAKELGETFAQLEKDLRAQYLIGYSSENNRNDQTYRTVEIKVDHPNVQVRTVRGYIP